MTKIKGLLTVFALVLAIFSSMGITSAASCGTANDNQLIFRMYANTNSHAADYTKTQYTREICYTDFFDQSYDVSANLRACIDNANRLFNISARTNSHASYDAVSEYNISICYGGFESCRIASSSTGCNEANNENAIVYLSSRTNAHLSRIPNNLYYPFVLCCEGKSGKPIKRGLLIKCADYKTETSCNANAAAGEFDSSCPANQNCKCEWSLTERKCVVAYTDPATNCKCTKTASEICDENNQMEIIATASPSGCSAAGCISGEKVPCRFELSEMPFFGWPQFVVSLASIAILYFIFIKGKRR